MSLAAARRRLLSPPRGAALLRCPFGHSAARALCVKPTPIDDAAATAPPPPPPSLAAGTWPYVLSKKAITIEDPDNFNRWLMPVAGAFVHVSIGSVYAWSIWNNPLMRQLGVVAQAAGDWSLGGALSVFSCTAVALGTTTFVLGPWQERSGPRMVAFAVAHCYSAAFLLTGLAMHRAAQHNKAHSVIGADRGV